MNLTQFITRISQHESSVCRCSTGLLTLLTSLGLVVGFGAMATATPLTVLHQDHDEVEIKVMLQEINPESNDEIEAVVIEEIALDDHKHLKTIDLKQIQKAEAKQDGDIELVVVAEGDSDGQVEVLKKHKGRLHKLLSDDNVKVEVIVTDEANSDGPRLLKKLKSSHDALNSKLQLGSGDHKVFVVGSDSDDATVLHQHKHLVEILHNQESGKNDLRSLANKLRQLADQLEAMHDEKHSAKNKSGKRIKVAPKGQNKFHIEKKSVKSKPGQKVMQWTTSADDKIVVAEPGQAKAMIVKVKPDEGQDHAHSHGKQQKKIVLHGDVHEKLGNLFVEKIQVDSKDPAAVARKIMGQIKKNSPKQNVVVEAITTEKDTDEPKASTFKWKTSQKDTDSAISDLRKELKELRRQIKKLQADRDND